MIGTDMGSPHAAPQPGPAPPAADPTRHQKPMTVDRCVRCRLFLLAVKCRTFEPRRQAAA